MFLPKNVDFYFKYDECSNFDFFFRDSPSEEKNVAQALLEQILFRYF